jgi:hypothetical protein
MQVVYLQFLSIKEHTICNLTLIVAMPTDDSWLLGLSMKAAEAFHETSDLFLIGTKKTFLIYIYIYIFNIHQFLLGTVAV